MIRDLSARLGAMTFEPRISESTMSGGNAGRLYDSKPIGGAEVGVVGIEVVEVEYIATGTISSVAPKHCTHIQH